MDHTTIGDIVRGDREVFPPYLYEAYQSTRRRAPLHPFIGVPLTLSELTGPGPAISAITPEDADLTRNAGTGGEAIGQRIRIEGHVLDGERLPIPKDATTIREIRGQRRSIPLSWALVALAPRTKEPTGLRPSSQVQFASIKSDGRLRTSASRCFPVGCSITW